jgi:2-polyprenyl-3-methyl-5-hydroxy-6-metoxy-1,4-benzoquinol methylase
MANHEKLSEKQKKLIHEWTVEQVRSASKPNFGKVFVTAPNLLRALGNVEGKNVLELGCGNGYWLRLLARAGAKTTGIDLAENQIAAAKSWDDPTTSEIDYRVGDVSQALDLQGRFDIAFFEHVLLEIPDKNELYSAIQNAANTLKEGGLLFISDIHPFAPSSRPDNIRIADDFKYFDSGAPFEIQAKRVDGEIIYYKDVHWTLSDIADAITGAGLKITEIAEPKPTIEDVEKYPDELGYRMHIPAQISFKAVR